MVKKTFGNLIISITFGVKRNKITVRMKCERGIDITAFELALDFIDREIFERGYVSLDWVGNLEFLHDFEKMNIEGAIKGFTYTDLRNQIMMKVYEKPNLESTRLEYRSPPDAGLQSLWALMRGGFAEVDYAHQLDELGEAILQMQSKQDGLFNLLVRNTQELELILKEVVKTRQLLE